MRGSISDEIYASIKELQPGSLVFPSDFLHLGSDTSINMALSRLSKEGYIERASKGVYFTSKSDPLLGALHPSLEEVAKAIADKEQIKIRPTGAYALNKLGLSTQVPMKVVYLTNGHPRKFKMGKGSITFRQTTPKVMSVENDLIFLVIQALQELGKDGVTEKVVNRLTNVLKNVEIKQIREDAKLAPVWITKILYSIINKIDRNG
jgi:Family of unknown function (DUF6088)